MLTSIWNIIILPGHLISGLNENANSFFATRCRFWTVKSSQTLLDEIDQSAQISVAKEGFDQSAQISVTQRRGLTNQRRLASSEGGVWKNESFGSRWANKAKINAYKKKWKCFFWPCMHVSLLLETPKTKIWTFQFMTQYTVWLTAEVLSCVVLLRAEVWQMSGCVRVVTERWWGCSPEKRELSVISAAYGGSAL